MFYVGYYRDGCGGVVRGRWNWRSRLPGHRNVLRPQGSTLEARVHLSRCARFGRHLSSSMDGEVVFGCYGVRAFGCGVAHASATLPDVHGGTVTMGFNFGV